MWSPNECAALTRFDEEMPHPSDRLFARLPCSDSPTVRGSMQVMYFEPLRLNRFDEETVSQSVGFHTSCRSPTRSSECDLA